MDGNDAHFSTLQSAKHFLCNGESAPPVFRFFLLSKDFSTWGDTFLLTGLVQQHHYFCPFFFFFFLQVLKW